MLGLWALITAQSPYRAATETVQPSREKTAVQRSTRPPLKAATEDAEKIVLSHRAAPPLQAGTAIGPYTLLARMRSLPATLAAPSDAPSLDDLQLELAEKKKDLVDQFNEARAPRKRTTKTNAPENGRKGTERKTEQISQIHVQCT